MKGNLELEYNKNKTSAHLVFFPDKEGEDWPEKMITALLESEGIKVGIIPALSFAGIFYFTLKSKKNK